MGFAVLGSLLSAQVDESEGAWPAELGIDPPRQTSKGSSDTKPIDPNAIAKGCAFNRRVRVARIEP